MLRHLGGGVTVLLLAAALGTLGAGCSDPTPMIADMAMDGGGDNTTGDGGPGTGPDGMAPIVDTTPAGSPKVTIISPMEGTLITTRRITLVVDVDANGGTPVVLVQARMRGVQKPILMTLKPGSKSEYQAQIGLASQITGPITIGIDASNVSNIKSTKTVNYNYDAGALITILEPGARFYRGSTAVVIQATTDTTKLAGVAGSDTKVKSVTATVGALNVKLDCDKKDPNSWVCTGLVDFGDMAFTQRPRGVQLMHVAAVDNNGSATSAERVFLVDEEGPKIVPITPLPGQIVGGVVVMEYKITDPAGVDPDSVLGVWLGEGTKKELFQVNLLFDRGSGAYIARFDTGRLPEPKALVYPHISIRAQDFLGNQSSLGYQVSLDNTPPVMTVNPQDTKTQVATADMMTKTGFKCSKTFNALGDDPNLASDGAVLNQVVSIRARVTDRPNVADGEESPLPIGTDPATVDLLIAPITLDGKSPPLIVDDDGRGTCNNLNPNLQPVSALNGSNQAVLLHMSPVMSTGVPVYSTEGFNKDIFKGAVACDKPSMPEAMAPPALCPVLVNYDPNYTYAIPGEIFTIGPVSGGQCLGIQLDTLNVLGMNMKFEGAFCIAVRAADAAGNKNVSRPIRVCIERPFGTGTCSDFSDAFKAGTLPSCIGKYDPVKQTTTTGTGMQCGLDPDDTLQLKPYPRPGEPYKI